MLRLHGYRLVIIFRPWERKSLLVWAYGTHKRESYKLQGGIYWCKILFLGCFCPTYEIHTHRYGSLFSLHKLKPNGHNTRNAWCILNPRAYSGNIMTSNVLLVFEFITFLNHLNILPTINHFSYWLMMSYLFRIMVVFTINSPSRI